jgi:hypothetical protein
VYYLWLVLLF